MDPQRDPLNTPDRPGPCSRGPLIAVEGISGVGKTYLTERLAAQLALDDARGNASAPLLLEEFSRRSDADQEDNLGRALLGVLRTAASPGDRFLRGGYPASETLLLLAIKMYDFESCVPALAEGRIVLEGRSLHCTAVYQALIMHADEDDALREARAILSLAAQWRPLPDLTILITDDLDAAVHRAEERDGYTCSPQEMAMHSRAGRLYEHLAADDPDGMRILDRRHVAAEDAPALMRSWIEQRTAELPCLHQPWRPRGDRGIGCTQACQRTSVAAGSLR